MEKQFYGYYDSQDERGYYTPEGKRNKNRRRGIGGYIATALVSFIIGVLVAALYFEQQSPQAIIPGPGYLPYAFATPTPDVNPNNNAEPTPLPTERPMTSLDGQAPQIFDQASPIPDIIEQVSSGVVAVTGYKNSPMSEEGLYAGIGSGFLISSEGYILTNEHVVNGMDRLEVTLFDGSEYAAELIGTDRYMDIAVLKISGEGLIPLKLGDSTKIRVGEFVLAIGNPTGSELANTTTFGIISASSRNININGISNTYIQTDAAVNPGSSGGALLNMAGEVIGITSAKTVTADYDEFGNAISAEGLGFAIPINDALKSVQQLITKGYVLRPGIGISVVGMDTDYAQHYGTPEGVLVYSVTKDGPGHKAGLVVNDIITSCDEHTFTSTEDFVQYIQQHTVGDALKLTYWRRGQTYTTELVLADLNSLGDEIVDNAYADFNFQ